MKRNSIHLGFNSVIFTLVLCCSCAVINKGQPFDSFSRNTPIQGNYLDISADAFGKDISYLIGLIGPPDYQTGVMEYIDDTRLSPYWYLLGSSYEHSTIPIKAYAWKQDDGYIICCCSYNDFRITQMPQCLIFSNGRYMLQEWLSQYSGDDSFSIISIKKTKELSRTTIASSNKVTWSKYYSETTICLEEFYKKSLSFKPIGISKSLFEMLGTDRKDIIAIFGEPCSSKLFRKSHVPSNLYKDCWIGYNAFPATFYVDEYRYEDKVANSTGSLKCFYKKTSDNMALIFASICPDIGYYIEY